jgi:hypothetical protein
MRTVRLRVTRELLEQMLCLGDQRTILGVSMEPHPDGVAINDVAVFVIAAKDAPDWATDMEPTLTRDCDSGTVTMTDPGWR